MSEHELTMRDLKERVPTFAITFHHPEHGAIAVGQISERSGNPNDTDKWSWQIGWGTLSELDHRRGAAPTKKACETAWKAAWPAFKAARSEAQWYDAKSSEDSAARKWAVFDARKLTSDNAELDRLTDLLRQAGPGPIPEWVKEILARGKR